MNKIKDNKNIRTSTLSSGSIIMAYLIMFISGWRIISVFGYPNVFDKHNHRSYLVTSGDGTIIDHCQYNGNRNGKHEWQQAGFFSEIYPSYCNVTMWKPIFYISKLSSFACKNVIYNNLKTN